MSEFENVETIENFMSNFGIVPMETLRDEGLLSFDVVKDRILKFIALNIKNFKENLWDKKNKMSKLLVDLDEKKNKSIFTVRLGGKRIYRCNTTLLPLDQKIEFLTKFYSGVSRGILNQQIIDFCEREAKLNEARKEKQREKRREKNRLEREEKKRRKEEKRGRCTRTPTSICLVYFLTGWEDLHSFQPKQTRKLYYDR